MTKLVHMVCDYAPGDLAWAEIHSALAEELPPDVRIFQTSVQSFDTVALGFIINQLASLPRKSSDPAVYLGNCAPRKDKTAARNDNEGEGLLFARLRNGAQLLVVNSAYSLSFVKEQIEELQSTAAASKGSQFRSRDYFPGVVASCLAAQDWYTISKLEDSGLPGPKPFLTGKVPLSVIPDLPASIVSYVDSFGNLKTSIRSGDALLKERKEGDRMRVTIGKCTRHATVTNGSFNVPEGELAFAPGSSGYDRPYWELFKRGGSAFSEFGKPGCGSTIDFASV